MTNPFRYLTQPAQQLSMLAYGLSTILLSFAFYACDFTTPHTKLTTAKPATKLSSKQPTVYKQNTTAPQSSGIASVADSIDTLPINSLPTGLEYATAAESTNQDHIPNIPTTPGQEGKVSNSNHEEAKDVIFLNESNTPFVPYQQATQAEEQIIPNSLRDKILNQKNKIADEKKNSLIKRELKRQEGFHLLLQKIETKKAHTDGTEGETLDTAIKKKRTDILRKFFNPKHQLIGCRKQNMILSEENIKTIFAEENSHNHSHKEGKEHMATYIKNMPLPLCTAIFGTSLHLAAYEGEVDHIEGFLQDNEQVDVLEELSLQTPLHSAAAGGRKDAIECLINHGADVHKTDRFDFTALHFAAQAGDAEAVKVLIENQANTNTITSRGFTPLHFAAANGHENVVALLLDPWLSTEIYTKTIAEKATAYDFAIKNGHTAIAEQLSKYRLSK